MLFFFELIALIYFSYVVSYTAFFSFLGLFYKSPSLKRSEKLLRFCVIIPSYKEDTIILDTAKQALNQSYSHAHYKVVVIADSLKPETVVQLEQLPIQVVKVVFDTSTKVKSLNEAFRQLHAEYEFVVILDADNVMEQGFLEKVNDLLGAYSYKVIQGQRKPKNENTTLAFLDGVSEAINNHIYRQGTVAAGLSSSISGSGIVCDFQLFKSKLSTMNSIGGFDRELELLLLQDGFKVYYFKEAVVYDEKVSKAQVFQNQRRRWISSQYFYLSKYFKKGMVALLKGNLVFFNSAILRNIQLPRLLNIGLLTLLTFGLFFIKDYLTIPYYWWLLLFAVNTVAIFLAIPIAFYNAKLLRSLVELPVIFLRMLALLFKLKGANKKFIHTPHGLAGTKINEP